MSRPILSADGVLLTYECKCLAGGALPAASTNRPKEWTVPHQTRGLGNEGDSMGVALTWVGFVVPICGSSFLGAPEATASGSRSDNGLVHRTSDLLSLRDPDV